MRRRRTFTLDFAFLKLGLGQLQFSFEIDVLELKQSVSICLEIYLLSQSQDSFLFLLQDYFIFGLFKGFLELISSHRQIKAIVNIYRFFLHSFYLLLSFFLFIFLWIYLFFSFLVFFDSLQDFILRINMYYWLNPCIRYYSHVFCINAGQYLIYLMYSLTTGAYSLLFFLLFSPSSIQKNKDDNNSNEIEQIRSISEEYYLIKLHVYNKIMLYALYDNEYFIYLQSYR